MRTHVLDTHRTDQHDRQVPAGGRGIAVLRVTTIHANTAGASARYYTRYLADDGPEGEGQWHGRNAVEPRSLRNGVDRGSRSAPVRPRPRNGDTARAARSWTATTPRAS